MAASQDLFEIVEGGATAVHGPTKVFIAATVASPVLVDLTSAGGVRLLSRPVGLFLHSPASGKTMQVGKVKDSVGELLPPNQILFKDCFDGVIADLRFTYTKGAFESDVILREDISAIVAAQPDFAGDVTVRLETWNEFMGSPEPRIINRVLKEEMDPAVRAKMAEPDLVDQLLDFGDQFFGAGKAFARGDEPVRDDKTPAVVELSSADGNDPVVVAKLWYHQNERTFLIESVSVDELRGKLAFLPKGAAKPLLGRASRKEMALALPVLPSKRSGTQAMKLIAGNARRDTRGVILDYVTVSGSASYTFSTGSYFVAGNTYFGGTLYFQPGCIIKLAPNAYLMTYGGVNSTATAGNPAVFTSRDDDLIGELIAGSTGNPAQAASPAIRVYFMPVSTTLSNLRFRWAQTGIEYNQSSSGPVITHYLSDTRFDQCGVGVRCVGNACPSLSNVKYCSITTPVVQSYSGCGSAFMTEDCGAAFDPPSAYAATEKPGVAAMGDLNDDHLPDLVTASTTANQVMIRLGKGDGTFLAATVLNLGSAVSGLAIADINQDLWPDIIVTHSAAGTVGICLQQANGAFLAEQTFLAGASPVAVAIADMNGAATRDFAPDLVVANYNSGTVSVLLRSSATLTSVAYGSPQALTVGTNPRALVLGDFDRDGQRDIAVANQGSGNISIILRNPDGTFKPAVSYATGTATPRSPYSLVLEDFDLDGWQDLAVANYDGKSVAVLLGNAQSAGTFLTAVNYSTGTGNPCKGVAVGDLDGDSRVDLVTVNESGTSLLSVFHGNGNGTFSVHRDFGASAAGASVQVGDLNRDGRSDVVIENPSGSGSLQVTINSSTLPDSSFAPKTDYPTTSSADAVLLARLTTDAGANIDPNLDFAVASSSGDNVQIFSGDGLGGFTPALTLPIVNGVGPTAHGPVAIACADLNQDGYRDLVTANYNGGGSGTITVWLKSPTSAGWAQGINYAVGRQGTRALVLGNFHGDSTRFLDAVVANSVDDPSPAFSKLSFFPGNGDGTFGSPVAVDLGIASAKPWALASGDFDRDAKLDLAVVDRDAGKVTILRGTGNGGFTLVVHLSVGVLPSAVAVGDFDRDGYDDLVVANETSGTLQVFVNDRTGHFPASNTYTTSGQPNGMAVLDANLDGRVDVLVTSKSQAKVDIFRGLGNGKFLPAAQSFATASQPVAIAFGQLDNDSKQDMVVACSTVSGNVTRLMSNQSTVPELVTFALPKQANMNLSKKTESDTETAIAINHADPENVVGFSIGPASVGGGLVRSYSFTGGRTWRPQPPTSPVIFPSTPTTVLGIPVLRLTVLEIFTWYISKNPLVPA